MRVYTRQRLAAPLPMTLGFRETACSNLAVFLSPEWLFFPDSAVESFFQGT